MNSTKPSSAPSKNRIRSQSPINVEKNAQQNQTFKVQKNMISGPVYTGSQNPNAKILSNTGGFTGMMT